MKTATKPWPLLILICLLAGFTSVQARTGVAFVHGTGHQTNAGTQYWTWENINSVRRGLDNLGDYYVVNCNFEKYMWDSRAAGCLADQLTYFINNRNLDKVVIITHSNGGNVIRWILSNPTYDSRYPFVISHTSMVLALAPSSGGTPLANASVNGTVFEAALGWILGYTSDAVKQQQTHWMRDYNRDWLYGTQGRPMLPRLFLPIVGTDVETAFWDPDSYCGGYSLNLGLEITQAWLNSCSDGFLNCSSQSAAGLFSWNDTLFTDGGEPLSHNQSRRKCFGIDRFAKALLVELSE